MKLQHRKTLGSEMRSVVSGKQGCGDEGTLGVMEIFCILTVVVAQIYAIVQTHSIACLKLILLFVRYILIKLTSKDEE